MSAKIVAIETEFSRLHFYSNEDESIAIQAISKTDKEKIVISLINRGQAHLLMLFLQEHLK